MNSKISRFLRAYIFIGDFIVPLPLTLLMYFVWFSRSGSHWQASGIILMSLIFGYLMPGLASRVFRIWSFTGPFRFKYIFIHHGFIYSAFLPLIVYVSLVISERWGGGEPVQYLSGFFLTLLVITHHDMIAFKTGILLHHTRTLKENESVFRYIGLMGLFCYGLLGVAVNFCTIRLLASGSEIGLPEWLLWLVWSVLLCTSPLFLYVIYKWKYVASLYRTPGIR